MKLLKTAFASAAMLAGGMFAMTPDNADAQIRFQIGGNGYRYSDGHNHNDGYRYGGSRYSNNNYNYGRYSSRYNGYNGQWGSGYRGGWHDTSHYDYHPTTIVPHGNHVDVIPGHYDYHQSGHWH